MKKILFIVNNLGVGGAERLVVDDINEMLNQNIDVSLITLRKEPKKSLYFQLNISSDKSQCVEFGGFLDISGWVRLIQAIKNIKPDLVISQLWFENTVARIACKFAGIKLITFEQNVYDEVKNWKMFFTDRMLQSFSIKIIAVSYAVRASLIKHGIREERIDVIPNSVNLEVFNISPNRLEIRKELGVPQGAYLFIFIGRLIHQKAVDVLIRAFKNLEEDSYLLIVGQGREMENLLSLAEEQGVKDRIIFVGVRQDIPAILLSSDCFVLPSRYEGWPLVLMEALAAGLPIIVSDFEAAKEIIQEGNGFMVPRDDSSALSIAMNRIKHEPELGKRLGEEARRSAGRFSISNHVRAILRYT